MFEDLSLSSSSCLFFSLWFRIESSSASILERISYSWYLLVSCTAIWRVWVTDWSRWSSSFLLLVSVEYLSLRSLRSRDSFSICKV